MKKLYVFKKDLLALWFLLGITISAIGQVPTISSFTPISGPSGTSVTISGTNFSTTAANNIVYFGAVKGIVSSSTATSISVLVPTGATFDPISVTKGGLTAYSAKPFVTTFPGAGDGINPTSLATKVDYPVGYNPTFTSLQDINGDGKPEFVSCNAGSSNITYCKNTSTVTTTSFGSFANQIVGENPFGVAFGDLDGDGKLDAAVTNGASNTVSVMLNTSTVPTISFNAKIDYPTGTYPRSVSIKDIDGDGKPDLVIANYNFGLSGSISILKNSSTIGSISFDPKVDFSTGASAVTAIAGDLNLDGKADLVVTDINLGKVSVLQNSSTVGSISFLPQQDYLTGTSPWGVAIGDLDLDGLPEIAVTNQHSATVSIYRNSSSLGVISFLPKLDIQTGQEPINVSIGTLDGDARPDLAVSNYYDNTISLIRNISSPGSLGFDLKVDFQTGTSPISASIADFNFDNKPDLAVGNYLTSDISVFSNQLDFPFITSFTPSSAVSGSVITITGLSFTDATAVTFGGVNAASFTIDSPTQITAILGGGASGAVSVVTPFGTASKLGFKVFGIPTITSFTPTSGLPGTVVTITGTNLSPTASSNIVYFGAVKTTVTAATTTSLTVTVPYGATYQPISATINGLTAMSPQIFLVTFPGAGPTFKSNSFSPKVDFTTGMLSNPLNVGICDINVDGKSDLVSINASTNVVSVFRNTSLAMGSIAFATRSEFTVGSNPNNLAIADIDGDGKQDVATVNSGDATISILRNTSSGSFLTFIPRIDYSTEDSSSSIAIGDLDGDARPEVVTVNPLFGSFSVFVNASTSGTINMIDKIDFPSTYETPNNLTLADIDGDKKLDVILTNYNTNIISVFRNTSTIGEVAFALQINLTVGSNPVNVVTGDLDGDGKPEIVVSNSSSSTVSILRNISTPGAIGFVSKVDFAIGIDFNAGILPAGVMISDLDGDGKPDFAVENNADDSLMVFKNTCTLGTITFLKRFGYNSALGPTGLAIGDVDNDGKPDLHTSNVVGSLSVLKNGYLSPTISSISPTTSGSGTTITITGTNFTSTTSVTFGGTPSASYTIVNSTTITAVVSAGSSGSVAVTTANGTGSIGGYVYVPPPTIASFTPVNGGAGTTVTITGTNFTSVTAVSFGGVAATSFMVSSPTSISAMVGAGASGNVSVTALGGTGILAGFTWFSVPTVTSFTPTSSGNGLTVSIFGTDFTGATAVKFGTRAATSFMVISNTEIAAVVSTGLSGIVAVTTPGGTGSHAGFTWVSAPTITSFTPTSSGNGLTVTLTGTNFTNASAVSFGGTPATSFTVVSSTSITAVVGTGTTGSVSVTTPGGTGTKTGFTWVDAPTVTSFTPTSAGPGITVTITGTNFTGATLASFGGVAGTSLFVVNATTITIKVGVTGASGSVAVTTAGGTGTLGGFTWVPTPNITSFTPTTTGSGSSVTITGTDLTGATSVTFGGTAAASYTVDSPTSITAVVAAGTSGSVVVNTPGGTATKTGFLFSTITSFTPVNAGPGITVTLTGTNFTGSTGVSFGGTAATSFTVVSSTSITALVGAGTSGSVSVFNGTGVVSKTGFTWYPNPVITSFTPTNAGNGITVTIAGTGFLGATAVKFGGTSATSFVVVDANTITAVVGTGTTGTVAVTTPGGTGSLAGFTWVSAPTITSFTPTSSGNGLTVTLTGTNFSNASAVSFGGTPATSFNVVSATSITAVIGTGTTGSVSVTTPGGTGTKTGFIWVAAPTISSFTPTSGVTTTTVTITGTNFVSPATVSFGGIAGTSVTVVSPTTIRANVGAGGASGNVVVNTPGGTATLAGFNWYPTLVPTMTSFTPMTGGAGTVVVITGTNFIGATITRFGLVNATSYTIDSPTQITAVISPGGANGNAAVITPGGTAFLPGWVFINPPTITSFTPTSSGNGLTVTLTGTNFTNASAVSFGGTAATSFTVVSATQITAVVGSGTSGNVSVTTQGGTAIKAGFTWVDAPTITSFTPQTAGKDNTITITGTHFTGTTAVSFGGTAGNTITVVNDNTITVKVGNSGASGDVAVTTPGGTATKSGFTFIHGPEITSFSPTSAAEGGVVVITGFNLSIVTSVKFGNVNAFSFTIDSETQITAILGTGASGQVKVNGPGGNSSLNGFLFIPAPTITSFTPTVAGSGTTITITGTDFTGATLVSFGGISASSFTVVNSTTITAILGAGASGNVLVTTPGGTATKAGFTHNGLRPANDEDELYAQVYPNPFQNRIYVSFQSEEVGLPVTLQVCSINGTILQMQESTSVYGTNVLEVNLENEASGLILLHLQKGEMTRHIQIIKK